MIEDVEITDNEFLRQFELEVGENMARIEYALQDRKIFLTKYEMSDDMEEQARKLIEEYEGHASSKMHKETPNNL